jgi:hypothetical protein
MQEFCKRNDLPAFVGEFGVTDKKETPSRVLDVSRRRSRAAT